METPENPPGFIILTEARKAVWDNGFRPGRGGESGSWLRYLYRHARRDLDRRREHPR
jgi:hypothetical protein